MNKRSSSGRTDRPRVGLRRGAYLLPSLFTIGNIILGFYAFVLALDGRFERAAWMLFFAGVLDGLDGRIARLTNTESEFGREFDSLADVLTFGAAPAQIALLWGLRPYGREGWLVPLFFLLCTSIRLARFNVQTKSVDSRFFVGLPSPAGAGVVASIMMVAPNSQTQWWLPPVMLFAVIAAGALMVSTFRYPSMKKLDLRRRLSYRSALVMAVFLLILVSHPPAFFLSAALVYASSGPFNWLVGRLRRRPAFEPVVPDAVVPDSAVPESTVPDSAASESTVPESAVTESTVPDSSAPELPAPK